MSGLFTDEKSARMGLQRVIELSTMSYGSTTLSIPHLIILFISYYINTQNGTDGPRMMVNDLNDRTKMLG